MVISLIHASVQLLIIAYMYGVWGAIDFNDSTVLTAAIFKAVTNVGLIIGLFAIYYSIMQVLSGRNQPSYSH